MNIAIVYATKGGTTRECAQLLQRELNNHSVTLLELGHDSIDLDGYDFVAVGFPVIMGKPIRAARNFLKNGREALLNTHTGYFMLCGFVDCFDEYAEALIPKELRERAASVSCFGGSLDPSRFKGIDRMIVKAVRSDILGGGDNADQRKDMSLPTIMEPNIVQFANIIKNMG